MSYSKRSRNALSTCHSKLQRLFNLVDEHGFECTIIEGHRNQVTQDYCFKMGRSKVQWPNGKHNSIPSEAVDVIPYINGNVSWNKFHCIYFAGVVLGLASTLGIKIRWGGNWDVDAEVITDQDFQDLAHYELL